MRLIIFTIIISAVLVLSACSGSNNPGISKQVYQDTLNELSVTKEALKSANDSVEDKSNELSSAKAELQAKQNELDDVNLKIKEYKTNLVLVQNKLTTAENKVKSFEGVFPLRPFTWSELQDFLFPSAKLYQIQLMEMQQDPQYNSYDYALFLQSEANRRGYSMSVQIDKTSSQILNTVFIDKKIYAIDPHYVIVGGNAINKVWEYGQLPMNNSSPIPSPTQSNQIKSTLRTYENTSYKIKISYPEGWGVKEDISGTIVVFLSQKSTSEGFQPNVVLATQDVSPTNLRTLTQLTINQGKQLITDFNLVESTKTNLANNEAQKLVFTGKQGEYSLKWQTVFNLINYKKTYTVTYTSDDVNFEKYVDLFQQMVNSFQIVE